MADDASASSSGAEAAAYERNNVKLLFEPLAAVVVERSDVRTGDRVLDVACGTGIVARTVAPVVGASGRVVGSDLNPAMLIEAATHVPAGVNIEWREANAEQLVFEDDSFDVVFCQQGLQFVPNKAAAASEMRRVLAPGGRAVVAIWRSLAHNMIPRTWHDCIAKHLSPETASVLGRAFSAELDDPAMWTGLFTDAGFATVGVESVELMIESDDPRGRMSGPLSGLPVGDQIMALEPAEYEALVDDIMVTAEPWISNGHLRVPYTINLITARK